MNKTISFIDGKLGLDIDIPTNGNVSYIVSSEDFKMLNIEVEGERNIQYLQDNFDRLMVISSDVYEFIYLLNGVSVFRDKYNALISAPRFTIKDDVTASIDIFI